MRTIDNNNVQQHKDVDMIIMQSMSDNDDKKEFFEDIDFLLIGRPLCVVNLDPEPNQEVACRVLG